MRIFAVMLDGPVALIEKEIINRISSKTGPFPTSLDHNLSNWHEKFYLSEERFDELVYGEYILGDPAFWRSLDANPKMVEAMNRWSLSGLVSSVLTERKAFHRIETELWCAQNNVPYGNLLLDVFGHKVQLLHHIDASFVVEQRLSDAVEIAKAGWNVYLLRSPYSAPEERELRRLEKAYRVPEGKIKYVDDPKEIDALEFIQ